MRLLLVCASLLPLFAQDPPKPAAEEKPVAEQTPAPAKEAAAPAGDRVISGSVDLGYRFVSGPAGNFDAYRTVVNLGEGPKVLNFDLTLVNPSSKWYDKITLFGTGWGGDPNEMTRLDASKQRLYDFHFDYRNIAYYNFLPSFANPLIDRNNFATQRGYDMRRRNIEAELRFRPGARITPYVAYSRNWGDGRGVSTFALDASNEYPVFNGLYDKTDRYRAGVNFEFTKFHVTLEQGGTTYKDDENLSTSDRNTGSRPTPFLGQQLFLTGLRQAYRVRGNSIFERAVATYTPWSWIDIAAAFLYSRPRSDVQYSQFNTGNFVNLSTFQFFTSQTQSATADSSQPHSSGNINLEIRPLRRVRVFESWMTDRYHTASSLTLSNLTIVTPQALSTLSADRLAINYNRQQAQVNIDLFRWLTVRAGHRYVWGDAVLRAPTENGGGVNRGELSQQVGLFGAQARFGQKLWINGDAEIASSDRQYFRTSLGDYRKGTLRARYQLINSFGLTGEFSALTNENPNPNIRFDLASYMTSVGFVWNPKSGKRITILGDYTRSTFSSDLLYYMPQDLTPATSSYRERAHTGTALVDIASPVGAKYAPKLSIGGSFFTSEGSRPTSFYSPIVKLNLPVHERVQVFSEWRYYGLSETFYSYEGFRSHIFVAGLRLIR